MYIEYMEVDAKRAKIKDLSHSLTDQKF